ncbi:uncharacterized protein RHO25_007717 [Cercospora beticola]|uniref:GATA-type domain-containing protein n=1 Tax=Cercospora beticola TaxID=122368 RepID=A0ABZ0NU54_CERBT|nr:hypothetical protein RHO25_007717 [Cercospora beticola]
MANLLTQPSQQELEAARQLVEHSQSTTTTTQAPVQEPQLSHAPSNQSQTSTAFPHGYREANEYAQPTQSSPAMSLASAPIMQPSRTSPSAMSNIGTPGGQMCSNCGTTKTPLWRRSPAGAIRVCMGRARVVDVAMVQEDKMHVQDVQRTTIEFPKLLK